jgi:hypothetical protein
MEWDELVARYRALGGTAENVRLGTGPLGRGIFVVDPSRPARLHSPENLLVPVEAIEIDGGRSMSVKPGAVGDAEREFFELYQAHFGWSAGGYQEAFEIQRSWSELPREIVAFIQAMGVLDHPDERFLPPGDENSFAQFVRARDFTIRDRLYVVPMIDLVNHSTLVQPYVIGDSVAVGVEGTFANEMLVRYNLCDSLSFMLIYGFPDRSIFAYSIGITIDLPGGRKLVVKRNQMEVEVRDGVLFPRCYDLGNVIELRNMMLGFKGGVDLPRAVFRKTLAPYISAQQADEIFEGVRNFNNERLISFLRVLQGYDGPLVRALRLTAINQLEALAACMGARNLP